MRLNFIICISILFSTCTMGCSNSKETKKETISENSVEKKVPMSELLASIEVDSLKTNCECIDAILTVTDLMMAIPGERNIEFSLLAISQDSIAFKEMQEGHIVFRKIITRCVREVGVTKEQMSDCPNYEKADANAEKLKSLKLQ